MRLLQNLQSRAKQTERNGRVRRRSKGRSQGETAPGISTNIDFLVNVGARWVLSGGMSLDGSREIDITIVLCNRKERTGATIVCS